MYGDVAFCGVEELSFFEHTGVDGFGGHVVYAALVEVVASI